MSVPTPESAEVRRNEDGTVDELVGYGFVQIERMDDDVWFVCVNGVRGFLVRKGRHVEFRIDEEPKG